MCDNDGTLPTIKTDDTTRQAEPTGGIPQTVPDFRLLQRLGEGGMGEVYQAEQLAPVRRTVAVKLIKRGMESKAVLARFDSERQALAMMSHPNIAQVFDAGTTEDGRPFFVMEFVPGMTLTEYCDRHLLGMTERLQLFALVCDGVQHAHHKGIIHRDLKPSNVLVTIQDSRPVPKIIDFGIAKATSQRLTEASVFTVMGEFIGTPEYMSPEQADLTSLDIDTRTDVYSLGVMLYELLVGAKPFDGAELRRAGFDEMRRRIREDEPPRPSDRLSGLGEASTAAAKLRRTETATLARQIHGDLDWIVMKALEKDRTRRYGSPGELAADVERHLRHEPVSAGPPSATYRFKKFVRRHTAGVVAGMAVTVALLLGITGTTVGMIRATRAEEAARLEAETARRVSGFLISLFEVSDPNRARGETITAREILDRGAERIDGELTGEPLIRARMLNTIGDVYWKLGLYEEARPLFEEALETRRSVLGDVNGDVAESLHGLASLLDDMGDYERARALFEEALSVAEAAYGPDHPRVATTLNNLANLEEQLGEYDAARAKLERALEIRQLSLGEEDPETLSTLENLAVLEARTGNLETARTLFERNLAIKERTLEPFDPRLAISCNNLATLLNNLGDHEAARPLFERALEIRERALGPDHPMTATTVQNLAMTEHQAGDLDRARELYEQAITMMETSLGPDHPNLSYPLANLAELLRHQGKLDESLALHERALEIRRNGLGEGHPLVAASLHNMAMIDRAKGQLEAGRRKLEHALSIYRAALPPDHPWIGMALRDVGAVDIDDGRPERARAELEQAATILADDPEVWYLMACACAQSGEVSAAIDGLGKAVGLGFADVEQVASDPNLSPLRGTEAYHEVVRDLRAAEAGG